MFHKKLLTTLLALAILGSFAACQKTDPPPTSSGEEPSTGENTPGAPADAALYRGWVVEVSETSITLESVIGRDYGAKSATFQITENTNTDPAALNEFEKNNYVELYYGGDLASGEAIAIYMLKLAPSADMVIYNGLVESVVKDESGNVTTVIVAAFPTGEQNIDRIVFSVSPETQLYMNVDELVEGTAISILHPGPIALSEPPQGYAKEIALYNPNN